MRQTGRTTEIIKTMPDEGSLFIIYDNREHWYIQQLLQKYNKNARIITANMQDLQRLYGIHPKRIFVDHRVWEEADAETCDFLKIYLYSR